MMRAFRDAEVEYLHSQPLGRIATVGPDGRPHVTPVGVFYGPESQTIAIGSAADMAASKKFRDLQCRPDVALVIDDLAAIDPWTPRSIEIRGRGETHLEGGEEMGVRLGAGISPLREPRRRARRPRSGAVWYPRVVPAPEIGAEAMRPNQRKRRRFRRLSATGATGLEPATSGVTARGEAASFVGGVDAVRL